MARRIRFWRAVLWAVIGGALSSVLAFFHLGKIATAQSARSGPVSGKHQPFDRHWLRLPLSGDTDQDLLMNAEEEALDLVPFDPDENRSGRIDGPEVAAKYDEIIAGLPLWIEGEPPPTEIVKTEYWMGGLETCDVCGREVNMGFVRVYNPWKDLAIDIPYIGLHFLEHGSFAHNGSIHEGRIDVALLDEVLEDLHRLPVGLDSDHDLLADAEELFIGTDPLDPDENGDFVRDGVEMATAMRDAIEALPYGPLPDQPYKVNHPAYGLENCEICGTEHNMGFLEIADPVQGLTTDVPYVGLHYLEHGSMSFDGTVNDGRADVTTLWTILNP